MSVPHRRSGRAAPSKFREPADDPTHNWWGVFPQPGTHDGITATHTVDPDYRVSQADNFTYAPTTKAQNSCMEVVTAYWNSGDEIWAWDWCGAGGPAKTVTVDADFKAKYTQSSGSGLAYSVQLVRDDGPGNSWSSYLYNYRSAQWELLYRQSGQDQSGLDHGWDMFEIYASVNPSTGVGYYCTEARNSVFDSSAIELRSNGTWKPHEPGRLAVDRAESLGPGLPLPAAPLHPGGRRRPLDGTPVVAATLAPPRVSRAGRSPRPGSGRWASGCRAGPGPSRPAGRSRW